MIETKAIAGRAIVLGRRKENQARCVTFNISGWKQLYGEGTVQLLAQRNQDAAPYPCVITVENDTVRWIVKEADVNVPGEGKAELQYYVGETVVVSDTFRTWVFPSLGAAGSEPPEPERDWVEAVLHAARNAVAETITIGENGNWFIDGEDTGVAARGPEGTSADMVINAKDFGVVGDGQTNDAPALNALVRNLYLSGGGTIYLPAGTYMLDQSIIWKSNVSLVGDGIGRTILHTRKKAWAGNFPAIGYNAAEQSAETPMVNCHFRDFTIDGGQWEDENGNKFGYVMGKADATHDKDEYHVSAKGIFVLYMQDCSFEYLRIQNTGATGLGIDFMRNVTINKIHCFNCGRAYNPTPDEAVVGSAGIGIATMGMAVESCIITDCIAEECGNYGIFVEGTNNNELHKDENGNWASQSNYTIANCQCINGRNYGIIVKATYNVNVANNIIANNARDGILLIDRWIREDENGVNRRLGCKNVSITDNQCIGNGNGEFGGCGIRLADESGEGCNVHIMGNSLEKNLIGINVERRTDNLRIMNNSISNCSDTGLVTFKGAAWDFIAKDNVYVNNAKDIDCQTLFYGNVGKDNELCQIFSMLPYATDIGYYDESGEFIEKAYTLTTEDMFAMNGHVRVGIKVPAEYYSKDGDTYVGVVWYDHDGDFIARAGGNPANRKNVANGEFMYFLNDRNAAFFRVRVGYLSSKDDRYIQAFEHTTVNIC